MVKRKPSGRPRRDIPDLKVRELLAKGDSLKAISEELNIPYTTLYRHQKGCMTPPKGNKPKRDKKEWCIKAKGGKCVKCGIEYDGSNACIFDFHHVDPESKTNYEGKSLATLPEAKMIEELGKCELLCSNCHRMEHKND